MHTMRMAVLEAMAKIPALRELDLPVEKMPDEVELRHSTDRLMKELQREFEESFGENGCVTDPPATSTVEAARTTLVGPCRSKHTTIRIPGPILGALHAKADELGIGYQTLIIRLLRKEVSTGFPGLGAPR